MTTTEKRGIVILIMSNGRVIHDLCRRVCDISDRDINDQHADMTHEVKQ